MARNPIRSTRRSILGLLLLNIDYSNLLFVIEVCDIANYPNDNTPYLRKF